MDKDTKRLLAEAERQGFSVRMTSRGHAQVRDSSNVVVAVLSGTASDHRSFRNAVSQLRRAGFVWPR